MSRRRRGGASDALNPWPGYVDALSTLLMVIIFVLLVFVLAQAFLSVSLTGKDRALDRLNRQMAAMSDMLALERGRGASLQSEVATLARDLQSTTAARNAALAQDIILTQQIGSAASTLQARTVSLTQAAAAQAADARAQLAAMRADLDRTVTADKATIAARLSDLARLTDQVRALAALRDELEAEARAAASRTVTAEQARAATAAELSDERSISDSTRAQIALLNRQLGELRAQLGQLSAALDVQASAGRAKDTQIADLGAKLNVALAAKVEELQRYRSEFFGRLRDVLANRPGVQVVGDRFVFQSEVLFPAGSADLTGPGQDEIRALAGTVKQVAADIPPGLSWILRVDGHADHLPVNRGPFASNWELSSQRAINVVKLLIAEGVPSSHLAATGFADFQPLDGAETAEANARNRRIEVRLTDR